MPRHRWSIPPIPGDCGGISFRGLRGAVIRFHVSRQTHSPKFGLLFELQRKSIQAALTCRAIASPSSCVEELPPISGVRTFACARIAAIACSTESAASLAPKCRSIIAPDQICPMGLAIPLPAISGAEP